MLGYDWPRVLFRDGMVLVFVALLTLSTVGGFDSDLPRPPCSYAGWREILPFFLVLSAAVALVEGLNWVTWLISRNLPMRGDSIRLQTQLDPTSGFDLLVPAGWIGVVMSFGLLFLTYRLHAPNPCRPPDFGNPEVYLAGAFTLGYGLLILFETGFDVASRIRDWIDGRKQRQG
jgi:hypothetical protein